jgi:N-acyl-D-aspartate/D-glutamate deacylase
LAKQRTFIAAFLEGNRANYREGQGQGGQADTAGYALFALELSGHKPDATTEAVVEYLLVRNKDQDHWNTSGHRPPSEASDFTPTYFALRALRTWAAPAQKERAARRADAARAWLLKTPANDTEDRVFRLWGLQEAGADRKEVQAAAQELLRSQRPDGGWGQTDALAGDAYATGSALVVLHLAGGLAADDPTYRRGVAFLLKSQRPDGSWLVHTRSHPFQTYYESGFPHGKDQFISIAAAGWAATALALAAPPAPAPYDLLIRHGRIVDGSGNPWYRGDLAVRDCRIVAVGRVPPAPARREIDARGLVVAPGFIDMHSHSDYLLLEDGDAQSKVRQGVTTEVLGEGRSAGPYLGQLPPHRATVAGRGVSWTTLGGYFDTLERAGIAPNVASYVGLDNVWQAVMGDAFDRPTPAQLDQMKALVEAAMKDGAFGLSSMLAMPPGSLATTDDIVALCRVVARHGGLYSSHIRNEGAGVFDAVREAIAVGEQAGVPVDIIHLKIADQKLWGRMGEVVALIEEARRRGVNVQANVYPYTRGNNDLASIIPPWAHEGGTARMLGRLKDPEARARLRKEIRAGLPGWYDHYTAVGGDWGRMLVSGKGRYEGLTMDRVLAVRGRGQDPAPDPLDELFDILIEEGGSVPTVYAHHTERDMERALAQPWCSIGSDGSALAAEGPLRRGNPHPRSFGTFPRVLGVYVRKLGLLRLEDAVRKMTSLNAAKLGLTDRGLLRPGTWADLTLFDPERVADRATYEKPFQYGEGIEYVVVNGQVVLDRGKPTGARPGRALRHSP